MNKRLELQHEFFKLAPRNPTWEIALAHVRAKETQSLLRDIASSVREEAEEYHHQVRPPHYNGFLVGSVGVGLIPSGKTAKMWFLHGAWNTKPHPNDKKYCAEMRIMREAFEQGCQHIVGIAIVGRLRKEDVGVIPTLRPCEACQMLMATKYHQILSQESLILTKNPESFAEETLTVAELIES